MFEMPSGFVMVDTPDQLADLGRRQIAKITGLSEAEVNSTEVSAVTTGILNIKDNLALEISQHELYQLLSKYNYAADNERLFLENGQSFFQAAQVLCDLGVRMVSYGNFVPSYEKALTKQRKNWLTPNEYNSLLIGAMTLDTAMEYTATVKHIFPKANTSIIDIEGRETTVAPGYICASGLSIPFINDSLASIQTNYLLHKLEGDRTHGQGKLRTLISEAWRCLSDNGLLVMCEGCINAITESEGDTDKGLDIITSTIKQQGFSNVTLEIALAYSTRREMVKHFRTSDGLNRETVIDDACTTLITATKSQSVIYL